MKYVKILLVVIILGAIPGAYYIGRNSTHETNLVPDAIDQKLSVTPIPEIANKSEETTASQDRNGDYVGEIKSIAYTHSSYSLSIDYVQWISPCADCPNNFKIINANPKIRTFPVSENADVRVISLPDYGINLNQKVSLDTFIGLMDGTKQTEELGFTYYPSVLYKITLKDGIVTAIRAQYLP